MVDEDIHDALDEMDHDGSVQAGYEMGVIHRDCEEFQEFLKDMERLSQRMLEHHAKCNKR